MPDHKDPADRSRRRFLRDSAFTTLGAGALAAAPARAQIQAPAVVTSERLRPQLPAGVMSGDVTRDAAMVWSRTDRNARMLVEYSTNEGFAGATRIAGPVALARDDYTARVDLRGLPAGQRVYYRVRFQDLVHASALSEPVTGSLMVPAAAHDKAAQDITFAYSGDEAARAGASTRAGAATASMKACAASVPISSSTRATRSTPTARSRPR